ncbi:hypothetical protein C0993_005433 [Termitomyces sp. T159_Od127]|nr:hypothetical protein C0993_005433 [Termitomyces sp. T159_Od127]
MKKVKSSGGHSTTAAPSASTPQTQVQAAKKKANLKGKTAKSNSGSSGKGLLGGADYVDLMMGGRRKAKLEAQKLSSS